MNHRRLALVASVVAVVVLVLGHAGAPRAADDGRPFISS
jgi:hypothetical protein